MSRFRNHLHESHRKGLTGRPVTSSPWQVLCVRCGKENPEGLRFCQDCGTGLEPSNAPRSKVTETGTGTGTGTVALAPVAAPTQAEPSAADSNVGAPVSRLRPEVPNFDFSSRKLNESGPCLRCGSTVELQHAYCPQCGASLISASSPIADAAHNSVPPHLSPARQANVADPMVTTATIKCPNCGVLAIDGSTHCPQCGVRILGSESPDFVENPPLAIKAEPSSVTTVRPPTSDSRIDLSAEPGTSQVPTGRLVMLAQDGTTRRVIQLSGETIDLGKTEGDIILPEDVYLSPRHARFSGRGLRTLMDLGSLNGIYLRIRGMAVLTDGDFFLVGLQLLKFELELAEMANLAPIRVAGCSLFGSSTSPRYARLSERTIDGAPRSVFVVGRDETILGREVGDIVFSGDPFMSRRHAALTRDPTDGTFTLRDLGSSNGTFLRVRGKVDLEAGDHLRIGQHLFRYEMDHP